MSPRRKQPDTMPAVPYWDSGYYRKAARRAAAMTTDSIHAWLSTAVSGMYKAMQDFKTEGQVESLMESQEGLVAAYALLAELRSRREGELARAR